MKIFFFGFAIILNLQTSAQNYLISFEGKGASSVVHNVKVENLTSRETLILHRGEELRLIGTVGISPIENNRYSLLLYPNPMTRNDAILRIYPPDAGNALITIYGLTGKIEAQSQYSLGTYPQEYRLSGLKNGMHLINVVGKTYHYSGKLVCSGNVEGTVRIDPINPNYHTGEKASKIENKRLEFIVDMRYTNGDRLKFTGISESYSTVKMDIPDGDKTITFNFFPCSDMDNNNYSVVEIASQVWMSENLKTTVYNDGNPIEYSDSRTSSQENKAGTYSWYENNKPEYGGIYGGLYNWYAVTSGHLCPAGWHIPERQEWLTLEDNLGGANIAGTKLKETGADHWTTDNYLTTNETGFSALPGGYLISHDFIGINRYGFLWSSDHESNIKGSTGWYINSNSEYLIESDIFNVNDGLSVRCILGEPSVSIPEVLTSEITNVLSDKAKAGGFIKSFGGTYLTAKGVCWSLSENPTTDSYKTVDETDNPNFTSSITGLEPGTTYHVRAYSTNRSGTAYGDDLTFTTPVSISKKIPTLTTAEVSSVTSTTATSGGNITDDGGSPVTARGICLAITSDPTIDDEVTTNGTGTGSFIINITGLEPGTVYHIRAYATNSIGTAYGEELTFTATLTIPALTTANVSEITRTAATSGGNIISNGGSAVTVSGICWGTSSNPSIAGSHSTDGTINGEFTSHLTGLTLNTVYYVRSYATNSVGTGYGNVISFRTLSLSVATLTSNPVTSITSSSAVSGGNITDDGGATITGRGICWGLTSNPTIRNFRIAAGTGTGVFSTTMTQLQPEVTYYVRAYATNSQGTVYGAPLSFTTEPDPNNDVTFHTSADGSILLHSVGNKSIILETVGSDRYIKYSSDNGDSYNSGVRVTGLFSYNNKARILENGTIVLFSVSRIYYSADNMTTINPCIVLDKDGNPFTLHSPSNPGYPGGYFNFMGGFAENDGVAVMGNYANSSYGASPVNLYYSLDGITWKVFYAFGQNTDYTDNGTAMGGTGGTLLGDPGNPLYTRHIHAVNVGGDGNFYACTGDDNQELHFMKCNYNKASDTWTVNDLLNGVTRDWQRMRALGVYEKDGYLYWGSDGPDTFTYHGIQYDSFGIYKCAIADINDPSKHILLQPLTDACYSFVNTGNLVFAGLQSYGYVYISYDYGETWSDYAKPGWMDGTVQGIWFNDQYRYFETNDGVKIESNLF